MATMILREHRACSCGSMMFPSKFDKENKRIEYKCLKCGKKEEYAFDEVGYDNGSDYKYSYFMLNDDGDATWKCYQHGHCDFNIENLIEEPKKYERFIETGCGLCMGVDETDDLVSILLGNIDQFEEIIDAAEPHIVDLLIDEFGERVDNTRTLAEAAVFWLIEDYGVDNLEEALDSLRETIEGYDE